MCDTKFKGVLFDEIATEETNIVFYAHRKATFKRWCFDKSNAPCSSDALARAGFIYSGSRSEPATATCVFCLKEMIFEEQDDPWAEHLSHAKNCGFVELNKLDERDWTRFFFYARLSSYLQRQSLIDTANELKAASNDLIQMSSKTVNSLK